VEAAEGGLMLRVTWEWIAIDAPALDVSNTVAVADGIEHDLLEPAGEYERWATAAAGSPRLEPDEAAAIVVSRPRVLALREQIRKVFHAAAAGEPLPRAAVAALNEVSRVAPQWPELRPHGVVEERTSGDPAVRLLAEYARSAMQIAAEGAAKLRVCPAPSCGMFYRPRRRQQRWCSEPCGNRARFARHYRARRSG
jgi:predicted RNA-binding Zn ribbon-like protein